MGIKNLNKFLRNNCDNSAIEFISIQELSGKKIAIDISIYMYKFAADNTLIENIYLMLSIFRYYNIIPIFVFDGKPPAEKKELLEKRKKDKKDAEKEYFKLSQQLNDDLDEYDKQEIINNMDLLKKQFIYINKEKIDTVKNLIRAYGATYYDAPEEADELCASLVIKNKVWACLSEDMDMFVYGCPRVLRYLSLLNHTVVMYDLNKILNNLGLKQNELREICVLSGTDYNLNVNNSNDKEIPNLYRTLKYFRKYKKSEYYDLIGFYEWLNKNSNYIENNSILYKIYKMFDISEIQIHNKIQVFDKIKIINGPIIYTDIKKILAEDGFIFPSKAKNKNNIWF